jgi:lipoprotein-anchoring transpeptidase ErfK/SrfK
MILLFLRMHDPAVYEDAESATLKSKLILPPGPNNPVGDMWIGLSLKGYGMHGTPWPEDIGKTESHGCFRLTNWDARRLATVIKIGTTVYIAE